MSFAKKKEKINLFLLQVNKKAKCSAIRTVLTTVRTLGDGRRHGPLLYGSDSELERQDGQPRKVGCNKYSADQLLLDRHHVQEAWPLTPKRKAPHAACEKIFQPVNPAVQGILRRMRALSQRGNICMLTADFRNSTPLRSPRKYRAWLDSLWSSS